MCALGIIHLRFSVGVTMGVAAPMCEHRGLLLLMPIPEKFPVAHNDEELCV